MKTPTGWKKGKIPLSRTSDIRYTRIIKSGPYTDYFMVDIWSNMDKDEYYVSQTGSITSAQNKTFKTKPAALKYAVKIMQYINFGITKGVLK